MKLRISFIVTLLFLLSVENIFAEQCNVDAVLDGDSLIVTCRTVKGIIGIDGIDAPEIDQQHGEEAKQYLEGYFKDSKVISLEDFDSLKKRGKVISRGRSLGPRIVQDVYAWAEDREYAADNYLLKAEKDARKKRIGLWSSNKVVAPWNYRKAKKIQDDEVAPVGCFGLLLC